MNRWKITVEYDGRPYVGWQAQENGSSVQSALESAIREFSGETVRVQGAGRTDAGVHATGQVAHFDLERDMEAHAVEGAFNYHLRPAPIAVLNAEAVDPEFHARFDATRRHYEYRILNRRARRTFQSGLVWQVAVPLDAAAMHEAAQVLVGQHDFTTFRAARCQSKSPVKRLDKLSVSWNGEEIIVAASARSFLHHQIRSITGTLKLVGEGKWTEADVREALEAADRTRLGFNAPPDGLYLTQVEYEEPN